jgi:hypothetical protein
VIPPPDAAAPTVHQPEPRVTPDDTQPSWVSTEMPAEYLEIERQIDKLRNDARQFEKFAEILWRVGAPLTAAVRDAFVAMAFQVTTPASTASYDLMIELEPPRKLLVEVIGGTLPLDKRSPDIARALRAIQEDAGTADRVVFVCNIPCDKPLAARQEPPVTPEALRLIQGLGANVITTGTLFGLWRLSLQDLAGARKSIHLLHGLDGGIFR